MAKKKIDWNPPPPPPPVEPDEHPNARLVPEGERKCPICGNQMIRDVEMKVAMDICPDHGLWLDRDELPEIIRFIELGALQARSRGATRLRRKYEEALQRARWGHHHPWWRP
ncbi:MAG: hypothetical protein CMJ83_20140 [Planctomycetes bacterium]|nr:hypothetical protein [Planctomycetota bacterium]